jgi:hypothetical protein
MLTLVSLKLKRKSKIKLVVKIACVVEDTLIIIKFKCKTEIKKYPQIITTYKTDKKLDSKVEEALMWLIKDEIYGTKKS